MYEHKTWEGKELQTAWHTPPPSLDLQNSGSFVRESEFRKVQRNKKTQQLVKTCNNFISKFKTDKQKQKVAEEPPKNASNGINKP